MPKVIVTMPAYHAEDTLARTVSDLPSDVAEELILVDDASTDNTVQVARDLGVMTVYVHPENRGYGGNQKTCYSKALEHGADIVVLLHPDYQYDPKAVPLLIAPILGGYADMTFGSRFAGLGDPRSGGMPRYRFLGNRITTTVENLTLGSRFSEMHSGLRAYTRACLLTLPFLRYTDDFAFDSQVMVDAVTSGLRVVEVPIPTSYTRESSSISILLSVKYVAQSVAFAGRKAAIRGRRGKRFPVTYAPDSKPPMLKSLDAVPERSCALCGKNDMVLVYPSNTTGELRPKEFACTSEALAQHDDILQCRNCGMVSSKPSISSQEIIRNYSEMIDEDYLSEQEGRRELFEWALEQIGGYAMTGNRLLEVGSNVGLFLKIAEEKGWQATGVEPSKWCVDLGRQRFGVDLIQGTMDDLDWAPGTANAVVLLDVLEHLSDPVGDLSKLRKLVQDEGILALSTVNLSSIHGRVRNGSWPWFIRPHLHYFTPETLTRMLRVAGFRLVQWSVVPRWFHLSYVAKRSEPSMGLLGRTMEKVSHLVDPKLPVGWLGDVIFAVARPDSSPESEVVDP
jgi:2-polyprenyl-3-methyl-5-hydroxy-6-metoxy-1,4-benzoquinol methylase